MPRAKKNFKNLIFFISIFFIIPLTTASHTVDNSNWDIKIQDKPLSFKNVSGNASTVQIVNLTALTDSGSKVGLKPANWTGSLNYSLYNSSGDIANVNGQNLKDIPLKHFGGSIYYANLTLEAPEGYIEFEATGTTPSSSVSDSIIEENKTRHFNYGNLTLNILTNMNKEFITGEEVSVEVNVTDVWKNDQHAKNAKINIFFTNGTWVSEIQQISNHNDQDLFFFNDRVDIPPISNETFAVHVNATNGTQDFGLESEILSTKPALRTEILYLNGTEKCDVIRYPDKCEPDSKIKIGMNVTESTAETFNLSLYTKKKSNSNLVKLEEKKLSKSGGIYKGEIILPQLDSSQYKNKYILKTNATTNNRYDTKTFSMNMGTYILNEESQLETTLGSEFFIKLSIRREISLDTYNTSLVKNITVDIENPDGADFKNLNTDDFTFKNDTDLWQANISIPSDAETGGYDMDFTVYNIYGVKKRLTNQGFEVNKIKKTFDAPDNLNFEIIGKGNITKTFTISNNISSPIELNPKYTGDLKGITTINNSQNILINGSADKKVKVNFTIDQVKEYNGNITLLDTDSQYNESIKVKLTPPTCKKRNKSICLDKSEIKFDVDKRGEYQEKLTITHFGKLGKKENVTITLENLGNYLKLSKKDFKIENHSEININLSAQTRINKTGNISIISSHNIKIPVTILVNVTRKETSLSLNPSSLNYGYKPKESTFQLTTTVNNTGTLQLENFSTSTTASHTVKIKNKPINLAKDNQKTLNLQIKNINKETFTITLEAKSNQETITKNIEVTGTLVPKKSNMVNNLNNKVTNLQRKASKISLRNRLVNISQTTIPQIQTKMSESKYKKAYNLYQWAQTELTQIENSINQNQNTGNKSGTNPPDQNNGGNTNPKNQNNNQGGSPLLLIGLIIIFLLIAGFIAYTSVIPEEGDPLYNVLGGE